MHLIAELKILLAFSCLISRNISGLEWNDYLVEQCQIVPTLNCNSCHLAAIYSSLFKGHTGIFCIWWPKLPRIDAFSRAIANSCIMQRPLFRTLIGGMLRPLSCATSEFMIVKRDYSLIFLEIRHAKGSRNQTVLIPPLAFPLEFLAG
jgi:hypothetical protein